MMYEIGEIARRTGRCGSRQVLCIVLAVAGSLALAASASAFTQRGYQSNPALSFGSAGSGPGQMLEPAGIAVNQATGDIYVEDAGNNRVDQFNAAHEFVRAWGVGVINGGSEFQVCTTTTGCTKGRAGHKKGELHGAGAIAVDSDPASPSFGDVYVELKPYEEEIGNKEFEFEYGLIQKYNGSTGQLITTIRGWKEKGESLEKFEEPHGIAVGEKGELFVYNEEEEMYEFDNAVQNNFTRILEYEVEAAEASDGVAAGADGIVYIAHAELPLTPLEVKPKLIGKYKIGFEEAEPEPGAEEVLLAINEAIVTEPSTNVAVSPATQDALVDTGTAIQILDQQGDPVQRLGAGSEAGALQNSTAVAADNKSKQVLATDAATDKVVVFSAERQGPPRVEEAAVSGTTATSVNLNGVIAPGGLATTYWFRYSPDSVPSASHPCSSPCVEVPLPHAELAEGAEEGFANAQTAPTPVAGLSPHTLYHYIVFAQNGDGSAESAEQTFKTQATKLGEGLLDGRRWELVSPSKGKNGAAIEAPSREGGVIEAAADGHAITYIATNAFDGAEGNRAPEANQILSVRHDSGEASSWATRDINTPNLEAAGIEAGAPSEYQWFTSDLSAAAILPHSLFELVAGAEQPTAYERANYGSCEEKPESTCYVAVVNPQNVAPNTHYAGTLKPIRYMTPSGDHILVESTGRLTSETAASLGNLYEWSSGTGALKLVNALSDGTPVESAKLGYQSKIVHDAVSADGSRVVFSGGFPNHLYERNMLTGKTIRLDEPEAGVTPGNGAPRFQTASEDGKTIFFLSAETLTKNAAPGPERPDLYACEIEEVEGQPKCTLTDLSTSNNHSEPSNVQGTTPGAAADGSAIYFVANASLSAGAAKGSCRNSLLEEVQESEVILANVCNLYVRHREGKGVWGAPKLVAVLSLEDEPDWGTAVDRSNDPGVMTSRVSPNGEWIAFMSDRRLPTSTNPSGYNNKDANSGRADEEVYLYNATSEKLICASCDPSGARPIGVKDEVESGEGFGKLIDRPQIWKQRWLAANVPGWTKVGVTTSYYQSRYLLDNGRLFFNASQPLVPQDENGAQQDVYEYEPAGIVGPDGTQQCTSGSDTYGESSLGCVSLISSGRGLRESAFLDSSESGNDVFFDTSQAIAPSDIDGDTDVYDAAVCGQPGTQSCVPPPASLPPPCTGESCREAPAESGATGGGSTGTLAASGSGNSTRHEVLGTTEEKKPSSKPKPLTRKQKYAKALKACKKVKDKHKRAKCVRQAKKKYGPVKKKAKGGVKR